MMDSGAGRRFEDTMDALEETREATEVRFRELLDELAMRGAEVGAAADRSTAAYRVQVEARRRALASVGDGLAAVADEGAPGTDRAWPQRGPGLRGAVNRLLRWLLRDFLEVLDRRGDAYSGRVDELKGRVDLLHEAVSADGTASEALSDALSGAHAALQAALATHREMLNLVNAKDAEVLQRAVAGPLRRMEVLFDEHSRQQEALLSQLVGRRRELDEIVRALTPAPEEKM